MTLRPKKNTFGKKLKNGFNKQSRIRKSQEYKKLSKTGKKYSNRFFITVYTVGNKDQTRLGLTVSKKVGNAVIRNKVKRAVRECFRTYHKRHGIKVDINVIAKPYAGALSSKEISIHLKPLLNRIADKHV